MRLHFCRTTFLLPTIFFLLSCSSKTKETVSSVSESTVSGLTQIEVDEPKESNLLITVDGAGYFNKGMHLDDVHRESDIVKTEVIKEEGISEPLYIADNGAINLEMEYDYENENFTNIVSEIIVLGEKYTTEKGIGVGFTITDFIREYPDAVVSYSYISGVPWIWSKKDFGYKVQFIFDAVNILNESVDLMADDLIELKLKDINIDAKITMIRIF